MKYNRHTLKKVEELFKKIDYQIRYEKGHFNSGYCLVHDKRVAVINKFFDFEARINVLQEILIGLELDRSVFDEKEKKLLNALIGKATKKDKE